MPRPLRSALLWLSSLTFLAVLLFGDEYYGRMQFRRLCEAEAGVVVHSRIDLPPEYYTQASGTRALAFPSGLPMPVAGARPWEQLTHHTREVVVERPRNLLPRLPDGRAHGFTLGRIFSFGTVGFGTRLHSTSPRNDAGT